MHRQLYNNTHQNVTTNKTPAVAINIKNSNALVLIQGRSIKITCNSNESSNGTPLLVYTPSLQVTPRF